MNGDFDGLDGNGQERFVRAERLLALEDFEAQLVRQSVVPDTRKLIVRRLSLVMQILGAGAIGVFVAMLTVLVNFIVFTKTLHL